MAKYNTLHYCTVSASILLDTGLVYPNAVGLLKSPIACFVHQYDDLLDFE